MIAGMIIELRRARFPVRECFTVLLGVIAGAALFLVQPADAAAASLTTVVAHCKEDTAWLLNHTASMNITLCTKVGCAPSDFPAEARCEVPENAGYEAVSFLSYIVAFYDELAEHVAFIQAHKSTWHHTAPPSILRELLYTHEHNLTGGLDYVSLNNHHLFPIVAGADPQPFAPNGYIVDIWPLVFAEYMPAGSAFAGPFPCPNNGTMLLDCCAQFVTTRDAIRRIPREGYVRWLHLIRDQAAGPRMMQHAYHDNFARNFEYLWHVLFGQTCDEPLITTPQLYAKLHFNETITG
jgi:hypothetical protein